MWHSFWCLVSDHLFSISFFFPICNGYYEYSCWIIICYRFISLHFDVSNWFFAKILPCMFIRWNHASPRFLCGDMENPNSHEDIAYFMLCFLFINMRFCWFCTFLALLILGIIDKSFRIHCIYSSHCYFSTIEKV